MRPGDIIVSKYGPYTNQAGLRSGASHYTHAICTSVVPFVAVSDEGDMLWRGLEYLDFVSLGKARWSVRRIAMGRFKRDERERRKRASLNGEAAQK